MGEQSVETTNRIKAWELRDAKCALCGEHLGWSGYTEIWCDHCANQPEDKEELETQEP